MPVIWRISGSAQRRFLVSVALVFAGGLAYSSVRRAVAEHYASMGTHYGLERATELEPGNAHFWYLLGRYWQYSVNETDEQRAVQAYRK